MSLSNFMKTFLFVGYAFMLAQAVYIISIQMYLDNSPYPIYSDAIRNKCDFL